MVEFPGIDPGREDRQQPLMAGDEAACDEAIATFAWMAAIASAAGLFAAALAHPGWSLRWIGARATAALSKGRQSGVTSSTYDVGLTLSRMARTAARRLLGRASRSLSCHVIASTHRPSPGRANQ
jgi:hypothetical protein